MNLKLYKFVHDYATFFYMTGREKNLINTIVDSEAVCLD